MLRGSKYIIIVIDKFKLDVIFACIFSNTLQLHLKLEVIKVWITTRMTKFSKSGVFAP